ncbi:MAG: hypothetical protein ACREEK_09290 [Bradyrhizobium sp.]
MRLTAFSVVAGILALSAPAHAERPDCSLFHDTQSRFACYDNVSRAPKPDPDATTKPAARAKPATSSRKLGREN